MAEATFASKTEYVELSFSVPKPDAEVNDTRINGKVSMFTTTPANYTHFVTLHVSNTSIDGIQNVTKFENAIDIRKWVIVSSSKRSSFKTMLADIQYDIVKEKGKEYSWKAGIGGTFSSVNDTYLIPYSYKKAQNATFNIYGKKNIFLSEKLVRRLLFGVDIAYNMNLSGGYQYTGQHQDYPVVDNLERRDLEYLMSGYQAAGLTAIYSQKIKAGSETNLFVKANFKYINTTDFNFNNRYYGQISIGSNF